MTYFPMCNLPLPSISAITGTPISRRRQREAESISGQEDAMHDVEPDLETVHLVGDMLVSALEPKT